MGGGSMPPQWRRSIASSPPPSPIRSGRNSWRRRRALWQRREHASGRLLLESFDEPLEQPDPDLVLADLVLDAVLEIGVVVDLHDDEAVVGLLDVDAVEPLPDRPHRTHRDVHELRRRLVEVESAKAAL